jgi:DNA-binding transcriptional ArsR family regulator
MPTAQLSQEITQLHANICSALADPNRILLLYALADKPHNVSDLSDEVGANQPTTSRHLKILRDAGLVNSERQGANVEYSLADMRLIEALNLLRLVLRDRLAHRASLVESDLPGTEATS